MLHHLSVIDQVVQMKKREEMGDRDRLDFIRPPLLVRGKLATVPGGFGPGIVTGLASLSRLGH